MGVVRGRAMHDDISRPDEDDQVEVVDKALLRGRRISPSSSSNWKDTGVRSGYLERRIYSVKINLI